MVSYALACPATDQILTSVDLVVKILSDPELKKEARSLERRRAIRAVANQIFDFGEISRRSLAQHWQARPPAEREEFTRLFGDLLEQSYISKIENYSGEKIQYLGEAVDGDRAVVRTLIVTKQGTAIDRKSTRLNSSHQIISYAVFCLKKKNGWSGPAGHNLARLAV